jgi:hypothetical protein
MILYHDDKSPVTAESASHQSRRWQGGLTTRNFYRKWKKGTFSAATHRRFRCLTAAVARLFLPMYASALPAEGDARTIANHFE